MNTKEPVIPEQQSPKASGVLLFESDKYLEFVQDFDLTESQQIEFLRTLWDIMSTFVRLGFAADSVIPALFQSASEGSADALQPTIPTHEFNVAADDSADQEEE